MTAWPVIFEGVSVPPGPVAVVAGSEAGPAMNSLLGGAPARQVPAFAWLVAMLLGLPVAVHTQGRASQSCFI